MSAMVIVASVGAVTGIASAISTGVSEKKKNLAQLNLGQLDQRTQSELNRAMAKAQNNNDKNKIYADSIANVRVAQQNALIQSQIVAQQTSADAEKRNLVIVSIGGGAIVIGSLFILKN
jgi:hypothetical protein